MARRKPRQSSVALLAALCVLCLGALWLTSGGDSSRHAQEEQKKAVGSDQNAALPLASPNETEQSRPQLHAEDLPAEAAAAQQACIERAGTCKALGAVPRKTFFTLCCLRHVLT